MRNVILYRFPNTGIGEFNKQLEKEIEVKLIVSIGENVALNENTECYSSHSLSKGIGVEQYPWILDRLDLECFSKYEAIFLSMLSRYDVYKNSFTTEEMTLHYYKLINFWITKLKEKN